MYRGVYRPRVATLSHEHATPSTLDAFPLVLYLTLPSLISPHLLLIITSSSYFFLILPT